MVLAIGIFALGAATAFSGMGYLSTKLELASRDARIADLERGNEALRRQRQSVEARLLRTIDELEATADHQKETIQRLGDLRGGVERDLQMTAPELAGGAEERDAAQELASTLDKGAQDVDLVRKGAAKERAALQAKLATIQGRLDSLTDERDTAKRDELAMRDKLSAMQAKLVLAQRQGQEQDLQQLAARDDVGTSPSSSRGKPPPTGGRIAVLADAFAKSGVSLDRLLDRVGDQMANGEGGPLEPEVGDAGIQVASLDSTADLGRYAGRAKQINRLIAMFPLAAPVTTSYRLMSGFGVRVDPINGHRARHTGLDFSAGLDTPIHPTVAGKVVSAERDGAYGLMVVVDHGLGVTTAYAHMKRILVKPGQRVTPATTLGIMGSTGRSTGRHVHYEVRIDNKAVDPLPFVEAGKQLIHVRKG
jgi:murein DD-endopeptidase MepM/ murein hydrolase activator NlpD